MNEKEMIYQILIHDFDIDISLGERVSNRKRLRESGFESMPIQDLNLENLISSKKVNLWVLNMRCYKNMVDSFPAPFTTRPHCHLKYLI